MRNRAQDTIRTRWTDDDLDDALAELFRAGQPDRNALTTTGSAPAQPGSETAGVAPATPLSSPHPARRRRPVLVIALVAILVAVGLVSTTLLSRHIDSAAAAALNQAADAADRVARAGGDQIPAGEFRYVRAHGWGASMGYPVYLQEGHRETWIPADWRDTWLDRTGSTGERQWISGSEADAANLGLPKAGAATTDPDLTGPCRAYYVDVCSGAGTWQAPTQAWIAGLPTDPGELYGRLYDDSKGHGQSQESEMLVQAADVLHLDVLPASVRATLYRALAMVPGVQITDSSVTLDGQVGIGFSVASPQIRSEMIIDTATGDFIGDRETTIATDAVNGIPAGTVISYTAYTTTIVPTLGVGPS